nr:AsmA family protein [Raoultella sp. NCTC 9187]
MGPLIARGAVAAALATLVTPAAALLALVSPAEGEANQCQTILSQMKSRFGEELPGAPGSKGLQRLVASFVGQQQRISVSAAIDAR